MKTHLWTHESFVFLDGWHECNPKEVTLIAETESAWKIKVNWFVTKWIDKDSHNRLEPIMNPATERKK